MASQKKVVTQVSGRRKRPLRLLILSSSGGAGHFRAGQALHAWAQRSFPNIHADHYDVLDFTTPAFKRFYGGTYLLTTAKAPALWGAMYDHLDHKQRRKPLPVRVFDHFNYRAYVKTLNTLAPDAVVCTHFLPFLAVEGRRKSVSPHIPFFAVGTDFNLHSAWCSSMVKRYFVFSEQTRALLGGKGVDIDLIEPSGIPVMPEFVRRCAVSDVRRELRLPVNRFTVLILSGGYGVGAIEEIVSLTRKTLSRISDRSFSLVVVCGRNETLAKNLRKKRIRDGVELHVAGFIDNMHDYMNAADLLISKSGGLTMSEALACRLPTIIIDPIPGQERHNADVLIENGSALLALDHAQLSYKLELAVRDDRWRERATRATSKLAKPLAGRTILRNVIEHLQ